MRNPGDIKESPVHLYESKYLVSKNYNDISLIIINNWILYFFIDEPTATEVGLHKFLSLTPFFLEKVMIIYNLLTYYWCNFKNECII